MEPPFSACLASMIPYYETLEPAMLEIIGKGESYLHGLGFEKCRLRLHNNGELSRIEVPKDRFEALISKKSTIVSSLRILGVQYVTLDMAGYQSGGFDNYKEISQV
ncbi:hypothetical protein HNV12_16555 [Methanococcoides sp. SA1]|nr:hypothetical protein [Methanococcoides sp. SA1]